MKTYYLIICLLQLGCPQYYSTKKCDCTQIYQSYECQQLSEQCEWSISLNQCHVIKKKQTTTQIIQKVGYCTTNSHSECLNKEFCQWVDGKCSHFTGCSAFVRTTDYDCQKISKQCITNGRYCIQKIECANSKSQGTCIKSLNNKFCYWNSNMKSCSEANQCNQLPKSLTTDEQCRSQIKICTTSSGGGCENSGITCFNQKLKIQCYFDQNQKQECFWNENICVDKICENAPKTYSFDSECFNFLPECTIKENGGCRVRSNCVDAKNQEACTFDLNNKPCFWDGNNCMERLCQHASLTLSLNQECKQFLESCTIMIDGGCKKYEICSDIEVEQACTKDIKGNDCIFNEGCNFYDCNNAPITYTTIEECRSFNPQLQCFSSPYGGCYQAYQCSEILSKQDCQIDKEGNKCVWDQFSKVCLKMSDIIQCDQHVDKNHCLSIVETNCVWKGDCYKKECAFAPKNLMSHSECQGYLPNCTLEEIGNGCTEIPLYCKLHISDKTCFLRKVVTLNNQIQYASCIWTKKGCLDYDQRTCELASLTHTLNSQCQQFFEKCVIKNPINGISSGCQDIPQNCADKKLEDVCYTQISNNPVECFWDNINAICYEKLCINAIQYPGFESPSLENCQQYNFNCIPNNTLTGCIDIPQQCSELSQQNCNISIDRVQFYCFWNGNKCLDNNCTNSSCTYKKPYCSDYVSENQCHQSLQIMHDFYEDCKWNGEIGVCESTTDYKITQTVIWFESDCMFYFGENYTIKNGEIFQCQLIQELCSSYKSKDECTLAREGSCYYDQICKLVQSDVDCSYFRGNSYLCQTYSQNCNGSYDYPNEICVNKGCTDIYSNGEWETCYSQNCSVSNNLQCTIIAQECSSYKTLKDCVQISKNEYCQWSKDQCEPWDQRFETITITTDRKICSYYSINFIYNSDKTQCQLIKPKCGDYIEKISCSEAQEGLCLWNQDADVKCFHPVSDEDCKYKKGYDLQMEECREINRNCYPNRYSTACYALKQDCNDYKNLDDCFITSEFGYCVQTQPKNKFAICTNLQWNQDCDTVYFGEGITTIMNCSVPSCSLKDSDSCTVKTCEGAPYVYAQNSLCALWIDNCIENKEKNACLMQREKCEDYTNLDQCFLSLEGECMVQDGKCVNLFCNGADPNHYQTHESCTYLSKQCTAARFADCQGLGSCNSQKSKYYCKQNIKYNCHWNVIEETCVNNVCSELEQNSSFDTSEECRNNGCILKNTGLGCQDRGQCQDYNESQCQLGSTNKNNKECGWNSNLDIPKCEIKQCSTASISIKSHSECQAYLIGCTVQVKLMQDGNYQTGGCIAFQNCPNYIIEDQCQYDQDNNVCGWNGKKCDNKSCLTAPQTQSYSTHQDCQNYLQNCTVNENLLGCIEIPSACEEIMIEESCKIAVGGKQCFWLDEEKCVEKQCEYATLFEQSEECLNFMPICTINKTDVCQVKICEDYNYSTEEKCNSAMKGCSTDGVKCVKKHELCEGALAQAGCTNDLKGDPCDWVFQKDSFLCVLRTCETAPLTLQSDQECSNYLKICTIKKLGGCTKKKLCENASMSESCVTDEYGKKCFWDNSYCRDIQCKDLIGSSHQQCTEQMQGCTIGRNGKCAILQLCSFIKTKDECILGSDGPCLWISGFVNQDLTKGACFQYSSCNSIEWTSDEMCKMISPYCTTDGKSCVSQTECAETNTNGGCLTGNDGECIQIVIDNQNQCQKFIECSQARFSTHEECQLANKKCTTHSDNVCIKLMDCSDYKKKESCRINKVGQLKVNNQVISTGKCVWIENRSYCQDEKCEDLIFTTHEQCNLALNSCTSNGKFCISQKYCEEYKNQSECISALGLDGVCIWSGSSCFLMKSCKSASDDERACKIANDRCNWIQESEQFSNKCIEHTCETYFKANNKCIQVYNWNHSQQQFCQQDQNGKCVEFNPQILTQSQCFSQSQQTFRWIDKCTVCQEIKSFQQQIEIQGLYLSQESEVMVISKLGRLLILPFEMAIFFCLI